MNAVTIMFHDVVTVTGETCNSDSCTLTICNEAATVHVFLPADKLHIAKTIATLFNAAIQREHKEAAE